MNETRDIEPAEQTSNEVLTRRQIAATMLGFVGVSALAGCDADASLSQSAVDTLSLYGSSVGWADSVLGAPPSLARTGDLAIHDSAGLGGVAAVIARGCITPGDGGGGLFIWKADSLAADDGGTIINPYPSGATAGRWLRIFEDDFNVRWFGTRADGTSDDSLAVQKAINACTGGNRTIIVPAGNYSIQTSLNLTTSTFVGISFRGRGVYSRFIASCANRALFDCTGNGSARFERLWLVGASTNTPAAAFLFARDSSNVSAGTHVLVDVLTTGTWSKAAVVSISSEVNTYTRCDFGNAAVGGSCVVVTDQNVTGITSYVSFPGTFNGGNTVTRFTDTRFFLDNSASDTTSSCLLLQNARDVALSSCFFTALRGRAAIECRTGVSGLVINGSSAEAGGSSAMLWLAADCVLNASHVQMCASGAKFYGSTGSVVRNSSFHGIFEADYSIDVDTFNSNMVTALGLSFRARTQCIGNVFWGATAPATSYIFPTDSRSNIYHEGVADGSLTRRTWHLGDQHRLDRFRTNYIQATLYQDRIQNLGSTSGAINIDLALGSLAQIRLVGNGVINFSSGVGAVGGSGTCSVDFEEGARATILIEQDAVGGRTLTYVSNILTAWQPSPRAGSRNSLTLVMDACGMWIPVASSNDL